LTVRLLTGDCRAMLRELPERSIHSAVFSPPYFGLRDYGSGTWVGGDPECDHYPSEEWLESQINRANQLKGPPRRQTEAARGRFIEGGICPKCNARLIEPTIWGGSEECDHVWGDLLPPALPGPGNKGPTTSSTLNNPWRNEEIKVENPHGGAFCQLCGAWRGAFGLEPTPELYVQHTVEIFREIARVLRDDGTLWLNIGDSYAGSGKGGNPDDASFRKQATNFGSLTYTGDTARQAAVVNITRDVKSAWKIKPKDRMMIPHRVAIALCDDGWWIRDEIVWSKNGMPESVEDRTCKAHEFIFMLSKARRYFYDHWNIMEMADRGYAGSEFHTGKTSDHELGRSSQHERVGSRVGRSGNKARKAASERGVPVDTDGSTNGAVAGSVPWEGSTRVCRSVWRMGTMPYPGSHFATFPPALPERCIKAGTSEHGCCPTCGAPWRRIVAKMGEPDIAHQLACGSDESGEYHGQATKDYEGAGVQDASAVKARILDGMRQKMTLGWYPTCKCIKAPALWKYPKRPPFKASKDEQDLWEAECRRLDSDNQAICKLIAASPVVPATVLDPFGGAGTTSLVAERLGRNSIYIDLNPSYATMARERIGGEAPLLTRFLDG
jgi:DNA modification methylase